jgi:hypothetical protein
MPIGASNSLDGTSMCVADSHRLGSGTVLCNLSSEASTMTNISRRKFLGKSALAATLAPLAASTLTSPFVRSVRAAEPGPNDKVRLGLIGCGGMGQVTSNASSLTRSRLRRGLRRGRREDRQRRRDLRKKRGKKPETVKDFRRVLDRKDVDVVLIATPDHWHALPMVLACQAGKDVYVEKPLAKTIDEGRAMLEAAKRHQRVVQMGSQWRSCKHIMEAGEFIRSGKLGKVSIVRGWAYLDWLPSIGKPADCPPPAGVDYDMWLGPAPSGLSTPTASISTSAGSGITPAAS